MKRPVAEWQSDGQADRLAELEKLLADESAVAEQKIRIKELGTTVGQKSALEKEQQTQQRQIAQAEARLAEIERLVTEWERVGQKIQAEVNERLKTEDYATDDFAALAELDAQVAAVGYEAAAHEAARQKRDELADAQTRQGELKQAEAAVKPLEDALAHLAEQITIQQVAVARSAEPA